MPSQWLNRQADNTCETSAASKYRRNRFRKFADLFENHPAPLRILDVGGTASFCPLFPATHVARL